jgi:hypothetical protein
LFDLNPEQPLHHPARVSDNKEMLLRVGAATKDEAIAPDIRERCMDLQRLQISEAQLKSIPNWRMR